MYRLYGAEYETRVQAIHRPGDHHGFLDVASYFDYFDWVFQRSTPNTFKLKWPRALSSLTEIDPRSSITLTLTLTLTWIGQDRGFPVPSRMGGTGPRRQCTSIWPECVPHPCWIQLEFMVQRLCLHHTASTAAE